MARPMHDAELDRAALGKPDRFQGPPTGRDDVALLSLRAPRVKATMHFHRDIPHDRGRHEVLGVTPQDALLLGRRRWFAPTVWQFGCVSRCVRTAPCLLENASPPNLIEIIRKISCDCVLRPHSLSRDAESYGGRHRSIQPAGRRCAGEALSGVDRQSRQAYA